MNITKNVIFKYLLNFGNKLIIYEVTNKNEKYSNKNSKVRINNLTFKNHRKIIISEIIILYFLGLKFNCLQRKTKYGKKKIKVYAGIVKFIKFPYNFVLNEILF